MGNQDLIEIAGKVFDVDSSDVVAKLGIQLLIRMYGGFEFEALDIMRYRKFASKVVSNFVSFVQIQTLPPAAAEQHCKRTFYQVIEWTKRDEDLSNGKLVPVKTRLPAAPDELINVIRCKSICDNRRCSCRKHGLQCTTACTDCRGRSCSNAEQVEAEEDQNDLE